MWRDILIILSFVLAVFYYFGLTPRRLSTYAKSARTEVGKRTPRQRGFLILAIVLSPAIIYWLVYRFDEHSLSMTLLLTGLLTATWSIAVTEFWRLTEKKGKIVLRVGRLVWISLYVAGFALSDMALWQIVVVTLGSFGLAFAAATLPYYIKKKRAHGHPSEGGDK